MMPPTRAGIIRLVNIVALATLGIVTLTASAPAPTGTQEAIVRETLAGTIVSFEMVLVPKGDAVGPFYIGKTEVTWDLYDVFALGRVVQKHHKLVTPQACNGVGLAGGSDQA